MKIELSVQNLLYDIALQSDKYAANVSAGNTRTGVAAPSPDTERRAAVQSYGGEEGDDDIMVNHIATAVAEVKSTLSYYMDSPYSSDNTDAPLHVDMPIRLRLNMPIRFSRDLTDALVASIRAYIVARCLSLWHKNTGDGAISDRYTADAALAKAEMRRVADTRNRPPRRHFFPDADGMVIDEQQEQEDDI